MECHCCVVEMTRSEREYLKKTRCTTLYQRSEKTKENHGEPIFQKRRYLVEPDIIKQYEQSGSIDRLDSKFKVNFKRIANNLKAMGIKYYKKKQASKYTDKQL